MIIKEREGYEIYLVIDQTDVKVRKDHDLDSELKGLEERINIKKEELKDHPVIRALRDFYWRLGIDPTKTRPSSEALARRFLSAKNIPKINSVVDAGNIASIETLIPIGIYDAEKVTGKVRLRDAVKGEEFIDISGKKHILERGIVLADEEGIMHLFPFRDALRTSVTDQTRRVLIIGCGIYGIDRKLAELAVRRTIELIHTFSDE